MQVLGYKMHPNFGRECVLAENIQTSTVDRIASRTPCTPSYLLFAKGNIKRSPLWNISIEILPTPYTSLFFQRQIIARLRCLSLKWLKWCKSHPCTKGFQFVYYVTGNDTNSEKWGASSLSQSERQPQPWYHL